MLSVAPRTPSKGWRRQPQDHCRVAKEDPSAANIVVRYSGLRLHYRNGKWRGGTSLENLKHCLVHGSLGRLICESRRSPNGNSTAVRREKKAFRQARRVDILEEAVQAIHKQVDRQLIAVCERGARSIIEKISKRPLFDGSVARIVDQEWAAIERSENLLRDDVGIQAIRKNFRWLKR